MQSDEFNSTLSLVVYGDIVLSINTQYNTKKTIQMDDLIYSVDSARSYVDCRRVVNMLKW